MNLRTPTAKPLIDVVCQHVADLVGVAVAFLGIQIVVFAFLSGCSLVISSSGPSQRLL